MIITLPPPQKPITPSPTTMYRTPRNSGATAATTNAAVPNGSSHHNNQTAPPKRGGNTSSACGFQMPLHYPRFKKADYERMPEPQLDCLLREYGLPADGELDQKRKFAMGAFLWPGQY